MNTYQITVLPYDRILNADEDENLLHILQQNSLAPEAPCGGNGKCGKCIVYINGRKSLACQTVIRDNITVRIPEKSDMQILKHGTSVSVQPDGRDRYILAYDIGTTIVVCYLLDGISGEELAKESILNPQTAYGADVISRIEYVLKNHSSAWCPRRRCRRPSRAPCIRRAAQSSRQSRYPAFGDHSRLCCR